MVLGTRPCAKTPPAPMEGGQRVPPRPTSVRMPALDVRVRGPIGKGMFPRPSVSLLNAIGQVMEPPVKAQAARPRLPLVCRAVTLSTNGTTTPATRGWVLVKPTISAALLEAFEMPMTKLLSDGAAVELSASVSAPDQGEDLVLSKLVAKRAATWAMLKHGERIRSSGELSAEQLAYPKRRNKALSRAAFDLLSSLYERAHALRAEGEDGVLQLHTTLQRLVGPNSRGCGVVYDAQGRKMFARACAEATAAAPRLCE